MAQQTLTNGPSMDGNHLKSDLIGQDPPILTPEFPPRPNLPRSDSRQNFQFRPPFSPQPLYQPTSPVNGQLRPVSPRSPVASQQFVQRGPPLGPGGTPRPPQGFIQNQQRPIFRPQSPFPRPPLLGARPQVYQQSSVPAFNRPRTLEDQNRSQTLDSAELDAKYEDVRPSVDQRPPSAASMGRSFSTSPNPLERKPSGSQESINISRQSSLENVYKKEEVVVVKPDSRPGSRMGKIVEDELKKPEDVSNGEVTQVKEAPSHVQETTNYTTPVKNSSPVPAKVEHPEEYKKKDMELKFSLADTKGDNDSGVDESTQGNDQSCNGDSRTPRKPNKRTSSTTPTKGRSVSRGGSKTPSSLQSPESAATTPGSIEKKKVPMNKVQVGSAPSPNLKVVKSKIGSLDNTSYKPGGGKVKIESKKLDFKNAGSRIEAKNDRYVPKGGEKKEYEEVQSARTVRTVHYTQRAVMSARSSISGTTPRKIISQKLEWNAKSKIGSLENATYKPKGGDKKIETVKLNFKEKAAPKVGSKDNIRHQPGGGEVKIETKKIELHAQSKIGSLDNVKHKPAGGEKKIFDDKDYLKQQKSGKASMDQSLSGSQNSVLSQEPRAPVADENLNQEH